MVCTMFAVSCGCSPLPQHCLLWLLLLMWTWFWRRLPSVCPSVHYVYSNKNFTCCRLYPQSLYWPSSVVSVPFNLWMNHCWHSCQAECEIQNQSSAIHLKFREMFDSPAMTVKNGCQSLLHFLSVYYSLTWDCAIHHSSLPVQLLNILPLWLDGHTHDIISCDNSSSIIQICCHWHNSRCL